MSDRTEDRLTWLGLAALALVVIVAIAGAVPAPEAKPVDPCGAYIGSSAGRPLYNVRIQREKGAIVTLWGSITTNHVHYAGTLELVDGVWRETYYAHPQLMSSGPWRWEQTSDKPLSFKSAGPDGWTLKMEAE